MRTISGYFEALSAALGAWWNQFWFAPQTAGTLGLVRVGTGLLSLYAIATYAPDMHRWFDPDGMMPTAMVRELYTQQRSALDRIPPHLLSAAYTVALAVLTLFTLGVGGRTMCVLAATAAISFFARGPLVTSEFEAVLTLLLVYLCVGNSCDAWSIRSWMAGFSGRLRFRVAGTGAAGTPLNTIALRLIQLHIALVHLMTGWAALAGADAAWWSGEGMWLAAARPGMSLVNLEWLKDHPRLVAAWSHAMLLYLLTMPILVWKPLARPLVLAAGAVLWIAFAVASGWVMFSLAMLVGLAAFVHAEKSV